MGLKDEQKKILDCLTAGQSVYAQLPTGFGKSYLVRHIAKHYDEIKIVAITPLKAIAEDQCQKAIKDNVNAEIYNGELSPKQKKEVIKMQAMGATRLLYITPESFNLIHHQLNIDLVVFDEVDCVIEYKGYRPQLESTYEITKQYRYLMMSATSNDEFLKKVLLNKNQVYINASTPRENIELIFINKAQMNKKELSGYIERSTPTIVYCNYIQECEAIADYLKDKQVIARAYHSKLSTSDKKEILKDFIDNKIKVIVATTALSRGFDKEDVRMVINYNTPTNKMDYIQKSGRAGRDGKKSQVITFINQLDIYQYSKRQPLDSVLEQVTAYIDIQSL